MIFRCVDDQKVTRLLSHNHCFLLIIFSSQDMLQSNWLRGRIPECMEIVKKLQNISQVVSV